MNFDGPPERWTMLCDFGDGFSVMVSRGQIRPTAETLRLRSLYLDMGSGNSLEVVR